jgi:hypothetical protein
MIWAGELILGKNHDFHNGWQGGFTGVGSNFFQ